MVFIQAPSHKPNKPRNSKGCSPTWTDMPRLKLLAPLFQKQSVGDLTDFVLGPVSPRLHRKRREIALQKRKISSENGRSSY